MDEEEALEVIALVEREFEEIGLGDLADASLYTVRDLETGEMRLAPPLRRLTDMLQVFERHMATEDKATHDVALKIINGHLVESEVAEAVIVPLPGDRAAPINLGDAPSLGAIREKLRELLTALGEGGSRRPEEHR
jgi:hypothetical protein